MIVQVNRTLLTEVLSQFCNRSMRCEDCPCYSLSRFSYLQRNDIGCIERIINQLSTDDPAQEQKIYELIIQA